MQPRNEKFFPFAGKARNAVERAAILPEVVAPRERWAKLAKWTTAELHGRRSPNRPAPKRTAPRHPARVAQIVARLSRRTDQILVPCAAYTGQRRRPATPLERHPARSRRKCTQFGIMQVILVKLMLVLLGCGVLLCPGGR